MVRSSDVSAEVAVVWGSDPYRAKNWSRDGILVESEPLAMLTACPATEGNVKMVVEGV